MTSKGTEKEQSREAKQPSPSRSIESGHESDVRSKDSESSWSSTGSHAKHHDHGIPGRKHARHDGMIPATCPVSGHCVSASGVHADTPHLLLKNGQRIFACSTDCLDQLRGDLHKYFASTGERWTEAPDMFGLTVCCAECKTRVTVNDTTPRLQFKHGQTLWFNNYSCLTSFLKNPTNVFASSASAIASMVGLDRDRGAIQAACPITAKKFNVDDRTHFVEFNNGQRIYCCGDQCVPSLAKHLVHYLRGTHDPMVHSPTPSLCGLVQKCICCEHNFTICDETTPRVQFNGGQNLYFSTNTCMDQFLENPCKYLHAVPVTITHTYKEHAEIAPKGIDTATTGIGTGTGISEKHKVQQQQQEQQSELPDVAIERERERFGEKTGGARVTPVSGQAATGTSTGTGSLHKEMEKLSIEKEKEKDKPLTTGTAPTGVKAVPQSQSQPQSQPQSHARR